jgi:hypothetical protein
LYGNSPSAIIIKAFPDYDWKPWLFNKAPQGHWKDKHARLDYLNWLESQLSIKNPQDWYAVSKTDFESNKGGGLLAYYKGSPALAAKELYPEMEWNDSEFGIVKKRQQKLYTPFRSFF